jgi:large subunit ribosomal protein L25
VSEVRIAAEARTEFGKGAARRIRRSHKVPAVLYGHGAAPRHIALPGHELMLALKTPNVLLTLDLEDGTELALPKDVQRDPIRGHLEHVDLVLVRRGEKVTVEIQLHVTGTVEAGGLLAVDIQTLSLEADATNLPTSVEIDVTGLTIGTQLHAKDITLPPGATLQTDPDALVINVTAGQTAAQAEADMASAEAEAGIVHEAKDAADASSGLPSS